MLLAAAAALCAAALSPAHAADASVVKALQACSADFFKAIAQDKQFPEKYKVHDGDMAYMKIEKQPLDVVLFEKPYKVDDLTVAGYIVNDEIVRYFGMPDMHTHFWGLLIKEDWKKVVDSIKLDWEAVDTNHKSAHANRVVRMNEPGSTWKAYTRPSNYEYPEFGQTERAFHVAPYQNMTMIFCSMQTAARPKKWCCATPVRTSFTVKRKCRSAKKRPKASTRTAIRRRPMPRRLRGRRFPRAIRRFRKAIRQPALRSKACSRTFACRCAGRCATVFTCEGSPMKKARQS